MRFVVAFLAFPVFACAAIWPETLGSFQRVSSTPITVADQAVWDEYGFKAAEMAQYLKQPKKFTAIAYRLQDPTGALGAFEWQRPADAQPSRLGKLAVETRSDTLLVHNNYLLVFQEYRPSAEEIAALIPALREVDSSPLPTLPGYLPTANLAPNSERYIEGPAGLELFYPQIPPSVAAFSMGAEAQMGTFRSPGGDMKLAIFSYPTHQIAMQRAEEFQKIPRAVVKRSGPLVAVIVAPPNPDAAEKLLSLVRYQASVTLSERVPTMRDNIGNLVINAFVLIGILLAFATVAGIAFGGLRTFLRYLRKGEDADAMIVLHLR